MFRRVPLIAVLAIVFAVFVQTASADPVNAKNGTLVTAICGTSQLTLAVNGNGQFSPAHVLGSTSVFVPTTFDTTFSFTPTGGTTESQADTAAKTHQPSNAVTCSIPANLNTFTTPDGTFTLSGTVTGFFTPAS